jgi:GH15 family glucan-1,4-alpha-glucosidase
MNLMKCLFFSAVGLVVSHAAQAAPELTVNGVNADYTTTKFFVNEVARDTNYVHVIFKPNAANLTAVEIFTNLDRRDFATNTYVHGTLGTIEEGIYPPDGNTIDAGDNSHYYKAYTMIDMYDGSFSNRLTVSKTGAYRLTARYKVTGNPNWIWYGSFGFRDHAIVVSPKKALEMTLYELNTLTANASWNDQGGRGVFADFLDPAKPVNTNYFNNLLVNCLWFQPIHPVGYDRAENDPVTGTPYQPGSPYATRDYYAVAHSMGRYFNEENAMDEFTNFVARCDAGTPLVPTINIMLDGVFNHTSWDAKMGQGGVDLGFTGNKDTRMGIAKPGWFSLISDYCQPANYYADAWNNNFGTAPDRGDFGKWYDVTELYFGRYAALVCHNPQDNGNYLNEGDWFDYSSMNADVRDLWKYFGYYPEYWLKKTGHPATNSWVLAQDDKGIDALRCDFGQGLPPQLWEYIINRTRSKKWNFVFMAETLDGGVPGYRSNRHFDILNENLVFQFTQAHVNNSWDIKNALEARRSAYNSGAILLNLTSHDEVLPDNDAWVTASRYGALSSVDGLPMIFYGQEQGIQNYNYDCWYCDGFRTDHELNFGKRVPHFKKWNQLTVFSNPPPNAGGMATWYGRVNRARLNSPALRSQNRYFLSRLGGGENARIFAVAKYEKAFGNPASNDVVLAFSLLLPHGSAHVSATDFYDLRPVFSLLGLSFDRQYNICNLASSSATNLLWPVAKTGADLWNNGIFVSLKADSYGSITDDGSLVQYLRIVDEGPAPGAINILGIPGSWSGWSDNNPPWQLTKVIPPGTPAAQEWFTNTIYVAESGGDVTGGTYAFKLRADQSWSFNWGGGTTAAMDAVTSLPWGGADASVTVQNGFYYNVRALRPTTNTTAQIAFLKTSAPPVMLTRIGAFPISPTTNESVTVGISLSAAKSPEERVFVRWTTNSWSSSEFSEASGSGTNYTATIPATPNGRYVQYYLLSSTVLPTHATADALTLNLDSNIGQNYAYFSTALPWPGGEYGTGYASHPATKIKHEREEAVIGNGYLTAMLDANGTLYDIYFPSAGLRSKSGTANEGYRGPQSWPQSCTTLDNQANGQMNVIAGTGGLGFGTNIHWLTNIDGKFTDIGQRWLSDDTLVVVTSNRLNVTGNNIHIEQHDFVPVESTLPVVADATRTNRGVYVKRFLLTNREVTARTFDFYYDINFNVKGDDAHDSMSYVASNGVIIVHDNVGRVATGTWCTPDGYGINPENQYDPTVTQGWSKSNSVYFATAMKLVTNNVTGAGERCDASWRDHPTAAADNQEGWLGKRITLNPGETREVNILIVGSWDDFTGATGTHDFWGAPLVSWFYTTNMADVQAATAAHWSNWLAGGVTVHLPNADYNRLFKRSLLVSALHQDKVTGGIIAGMHNGAYPFVWPRDGVYAAITFARTGHTNESAAFYRWLNNAQRATDAWGPGFFYQKYTTDGVPVWQSPQVDETASIPWGLYYHYLVTGDASWATGNWSLAYTAARASSEDSTIATNLYFNDLTRRMHSNNIWEDQWGEFLYSNASVVRGLRDAAALAALVGSNSWATTFHDRANDILTNGVYARIDARTETSDISQLGLAYPFEVLSPADARMTNVVEWIHGRQTAGGFTGSEGNLVENSPDVEGWLRRYNHKTSDNPGDLDNYWNGGPWVLATAWYGMYFARWQDSVPGNALVSTNVAMLDRLIAKLGPMGLSSEQVAVTPSEQKYPGFWLQAAWPNVWESQATMVDQMMLFLDYRPETNGTVSVSPKLPAGWTTMGFSNLLYRGQRFDVGVLQTNGASRVDIRKRTAGALAHNTWVRLPSGEVPGIVLTNGVRALSFAYDPDGSRVRVSGALSDGDNSIVVTFGSTDSDGDGLSDYDEVQIHNTDPLSTDSDNDQMPDGYEVTNGLDPLVNDAALDLDGDGQSNWAEYWASTDPQNPASTFVVVNIQRLPNGDVQLTWRSAPLKKYIIQKAPAPGGPYDDLPGEVDSGGAATTHVVPGTDPASFYRVKLAP